MQGLLVAVCIVKEERQKFIMVLQSMLTAAAVCWLSVGAFQINPAKHQQHVPSSSDAELCHQEAYDRRNFLRQFATAAILFPLVSYADDSDITSSAEKGQEIVMEEEIGLEVAILKKEATEKKAIDYEKQLIAELSKDVPDQGKVKQLTESLIREEEQLISDTREVINKLEAMESNLQGIADTEVSSSEGENIIDKLKESVQEKEDFIARLKRQSAKYIDPKTGNYKPMSSVEYKGKLRSTTQVISIPSSSSPGDEYKQALKDTVRKDEQSSRGVKELVNKLGRRYARLFKKIQGLAAGQSSD